jgi:hypothetical protein
MPKGKLSVMSLTAGRAEMQAVAHPTYDPLYKPEYHAIVFNWQNPSRAWLAGRGRGQARGERVTPERVGRNLRRE